jgi:hypothetical protein
MPACSILSPAIAAQYEVLRMVALGEALPFAARSGLMLFLQWGMWGWAQSLVTESPAQVSVRTSPLPRPARDERAVVVHMLATMAMNIHDRRTPWNEKLRVVAKARDDRERARQQDQLILDEAVRQRLITMTVDFNKFWQIRTRRTANANDFWPTSLRMSPSSRCRRREPPRLTSASRVAKSKR